MSIELPDQINLAIHDAWTILTGPQTHFESAIRDIAFIESAKISNDIFILGKSLTIFGNNNKPYFPMDKVGFPLAIQIAQALVFSGTGVVYSYTFANDYDNVRNIQSNGLLDQTLNVLLLLIPSFLGFLGQLFAFFFQLGKFLGHNTFLNKETDILSYVSVILGSLAGVAYNLVKYKVSQFSSNPTEDETLILATSFTGEFLKYDILGSLALNSDTGLEPEVVGVLTGISWGSNLIQFLAQTDSLTSP